MTNRYRSEKTRENFWVNDKKFFFSRKLKESSGLYITSQTSFFYFCWIIKAWIGFVDLSFTLFLKWKVWHFSSIYKNSRFINSEKSIQNFLIFLSLRLYISAELQKNVIQISVDSHFPSDEVERRISKVTLDDDNLVLVFYVPALSVYACVSVICRIELPDKKESQNNHHTLGIKKSVWCDYVRVMRGCKPTHVTQMPYFR